MEYNNSICFRQTTRSAKYSLSGRSQPELIGLMNTDLTFNNNQRVMGNTLGVSECVYVGLLYATIDNMACVKSKIKSIKSIFVYLMEKSTTTVTDAKVVYRILLGGQCYNN